MVYCDRYVVLTLLLQAMIDYAPQYGISRASPASKLNAPVSKLGREFFTEH